jgi:hypothetical protein
VPLQIGADQLKIKHAKYIQAFTERFKIPMLIFAPIAYAQ